MNKVKLSDKEFSLYMSHEKIIEAIHQLGQQISKDFEGKRPLFLPVLNGAFMFAADLLKGFSGDCDISFAKVASYEGTASTGEVKDILGLGKEVNGRHVVILEDIIDTGLTMDYLCARLNELDPASISIATLLFKPGAYQGKQHIDYIVKEVPNLFLVGYGLDYNGLGRNLKDLYVISEQKVE